jgi:hypothetical protein
VGFWCVNGIYADFIRLWGLDCGTDAVGDSKLRPTTYFTDCLERHRSTECMILASQFSKSSEADSADPSSVGDYLLF